MTIAAATVLLWTAAVYRVWVTLTCPRELWRTSFTVTTVALAAGVTLYLRRIDLDGVVHTPNLTGLVAHLVLAAGVASVHIYLLTLRFESPDPTRVRRCLTWGGATIVAMVMTWLASPVHTIEYVDLAAAPRSVALVLYNLVFYAYMAFALVNVTRFCVREANPRRGHAALTRRCSLTLIGVGCGTAVPVLALYALSAVLPDVTSLSGNRFGHLGDALLPWPLMVLSLGILALLTMPWCVELAATERRWRTLKPLWAHLVHRHPEVRLSLPAPRPLLVRRHFRERRVIIEINDALRQETVGCRVHSGPTALGGALATRQRGATQAHDVLTATVNETAALEQLLQTARAYRAAR